MLLLTLPTSWSIRNDVASETFQDSIADCPAVIADGVAVKLAMIGVVLSELVVNTLSGELPGFPCRSVDCTMKWYVVVALNPVNRTTCVVAPSSSIKGVVDE